MSNDEPVERNVIRAILSYNHWVGSHKFQRSNDLYSIVLGFVQASAAAQLVEFPQICGQRYIFSQEGLSLRGQYPACPFPPNQVYRFA